MLSHFSSRARWALPFVAAALCLSTAGCEPPASASGPATYFTLRTEGGAQQLRLDGHRLYGPSTELTRDSENEYRGRWKDQLADLRAKDGVIEGTIASMRTELHAAKAEDTITAQGLVGGMLCNFRIGPEGFKGVIGGCSYDFDKTPEGSFQGRRACGNKFSYGTLELPRTYGQLAPEQAALYLALATAH